MEVPLSEAIAGHQRMKDYTRKTAELARHREEAEASRDRYAAGLEMLLVGLQRAGMGPDQLQAIAAEYQGVKAQITQEITAAQAEAVQEGQVKLREAYGWEDEAEWSEARDRLRSYAHDLGYSDDQLSNVTDHRLFGVLEKARRYDAARAEAGDIKRTKRRKSGTLRPGVTGSRSSKRPSEARQRLRQTGRVDDAAAALEGILGDAD